MQYTNITLFPNLILDIGNEIRGEEKIWNANQQLSMSPQIVFRFVTRSKMLVEEFVRKKDLYLYDHNVLRLNPDIATTVGFQMPCEFSKKVLVQPTVVKDYKENIECEGVLLMINDVSNYATFSYEEFKYLVYLLEKVDLFTLGIGMLNFHMLEELRKAGGVKQASVENETSLPQQQKLQPGSSTTSWGTYGIPNNSTLPNI